MKKYHLFTPGPTPVPEEIQALACRPVIHHRTDDFIKVYRKCLQDLKHLFRTKNPVHILLSSGTGAMEAAVVNFLCPGDKVLVINAGKFGERWACIAKAYGVDVIELDFPWGRGFEMKQVKKALAMNPDIRAVYTQLCETSTGVIMDIRELGQFLWKKKTLLVVDAISGLGAVDFHMDQWHVDVCITASQKALMLPPGLGFISFNAKAGKMLRRSRLPKFYFDLNKYIRSNRDFNSPFTPAIMTILQLGRALEMIREEGLDRVIARHALYGRAVRSAVKALGLSLLSPGNTGGVCTAVLMPQGVDAREFLRLVKQRYSVVFAPGQGAFSRNMFRIGHVGHVSKFDIVIAVSALEMGLRDMGYSFSLGTGLAAAEKVLAEDKQKN
jgi:aspartate aminotransferase-like enzyme